jgi:hypothetical protein
MRQVVKQDKQTMEIQFIDFEKAFEELSGLKFISCNYDTMVQQLNSGAIFQSIFYTYKFEQTK